MVSKIKQSVQLGRFLSGYTVHVYVCMHALKDRWLVVGPDQTRLDFSFTT